MGERERRGLVLSSSKQIHRRGDLWIVPASRGRGHYVVDFGRSYCSCPDHEERGALCKHLWGVQFVLQREVGVSDGKTVTEAVAVVRPSYSQDWPTYTLAQTREKVRVAELLRDLCSGIATPEQKGPGERRHRLSDVVFAAGMKVYGTASGRRSTCDLMQFVEKGYLSRRVSYNSIFDYLDRVDLAPILKALIEEAATPLKSVETEFAVDGTGFSTTTKDNWFEVQHEGAKQRQKFVKAHVMIGVKTHVITAVEVTEGNANDSPYLPALVETTCQRFKPVEVSADKGYLSNANLEAIEKVGARPFIPFKVNSRGDTGSETWQRLHHYFAFKREEFLKHYHRRSNVETAISMIKAKFGATLRSKSVNAQKNEVLMKCLLHNLCVLVRAIYELGIEPVFWPQNASVPVEEVAS